MSGKDLIKRKICAIKSTIVGRMTHIQTSQNDHILMPRTYKYIILSGKNDSAIVVV